MYIDILKLAYKKDDLTNDIQTNKEASSRASQFLFENKSLPGTDENGTFDPEHFQKWFTEARSLAAQSERLRSFDSTMGKLFAYSPSDPDDNSWPHKSVRDIIEKYGNEELENGFSVGIFNKRGVFTKSQGDGGAQERQLAKKYGDYAKASEISWPRTAKLLRRMESNYSADAHREDLRSLHE